jgi:isopenicillin N synthase-like dioxygenase
MFSAATDIPVIDLRDEPDVVSLAIHAACRRHGFFYVVGHGIDESLGLELERLSHNFFALPEDVKARFAMALGGRAWRGWFPLGGELTSGKPDWKEGLYLGTDLPDEHPRVRSGLPLHGRNLLPEDGLLPGFAVTVRQWISEVTALGQRVLEAIARSLGLSDDWFRARWTADPLVLFRIFIYPSRPVPAGSDAAWGVGEHTDYGLLTLLRQDDVGGLAVKTPVAGSTRRRCPAASSATSATCSIALPAATTAARRTVSDSMPAGATG